MLVLLKTLADQGPLALFSFVAVLLFVAAELGYRIGRRAFRRRADEPVRSGIGFIVGGMLALLAFLLGITLSIAEQRYDARRAAVLNEANAIGTAWLRGGLVGGEEGEAIQRLLVGYTELRIAAVRSVVTEADEARINAATSATQTELWGLATTIARAHPTSISSLLVASLNEVFDAATTSRHAFAGVVPPSVFRLLIWTSVIGVGGMGFSFGASGARQTVMTLLLLLLWSSTMVLISDINRPRATSISVTPAPLEWTLQGFGPQR